MTDVTDISSRTTRVFSFLAACACLALGIIALYSSGIGLIDPKMHRAAEFALALIAGVAAARKKREATGAASPMHLGLDLLSIAAGLWSIWSFHFVQTRMETALYDVTNADAWPALAGLAVFLELCRRLWGWGLFGVGTFGVKYLLYGQNAPGILEHTGFLNRPLFAGC